MLDFQKEVIERSESVPVVVDFWAAWCGPCRVLGPVIEAMAEEASGKWELIKVDTQARQDLAQQYQIMSIPAVKMFHRGKVIAEFNGALPKGQIQQWLDKYLPSEDKLAFEELEQLLSEAETDQQVVLLKAFLEKFPAHPRATLSLAKTLLFVAPSDSQALLEQIPVIPETLDTREDLQTLLRLMNWEGEGKTPVEEKLSAAQIALQEADHEAAISLLIEAVMADKKYADDLPRKASVAFFRTIWGNQHPLTKKHRILFNMALY